MIQTGLLCIVLGTLMPAISGASDAWVHQIQPRSGSLNGGTKLTLFGGGFAKNQFNFGADAHLGNTVDLVSGTKSFPCAIEKDGCTETIIICITGKMESGTYSVRVAVDGEEVPLEDTCDQNYPHRCQIAVSWSYTPTITQLSPQSGSPGSVIKMTGKIVTESYAQTQASTGEEIRRVYNHAQLCELRVNETDELYGIEMINHNTGFIKCMTGGSYVGYQNVSFIISGSYGRSFPTEDSLRPTVTDSLAMYQSYAEIHSVSPSVGGVVGGTPLTILGKYFDETDTPAEVLVGGQPCTITELSDEKIVCLTPEEPASLPTVHSGNRGWNRLHFATGAYGADILPLTGPVETVKSETTYYNHWVDPRELKCTRSEGFFVPPKSSYYRFIKDGDATGQSLYLSTSEDPDAMQLMPFKTVSSSLTGPGLGDTAQISTEPIFLEADNSYYMEFACGGSHRRTMNQLGVQMMDTAYTKTQSVFATEEQQKMTISSTYVDEIQAIEFNNWETQSAVQEVQIVLLSTTDAYATKYRLGMYGVFTGPLTFMSTVLEVREELKGLVTLPDGVTVSSDIVNSALQLTVTFLGETGTFPLLEVHLESGDVDETVTRDVTGVPSLNSITLFHNGIPSAPVQYSQLDAETVADAMLETHSVQCPDLLLNAASVYFNDFEDSASDAQVTNEIPPFCGRYSAKNPSYVYESDTYMKLADNRMLCFAYKGFPASTISIHFETNAWSPTFEVAFEQHKSWGFVCLDLYEIADGWGGSKAMFNNVEITPRTGTLYVDTVSIGDSDFSDIDGLNELRRLTPSYWLVNDVSVNGTKDDGFHIHFDNLHSGALGTISVFEEPEDSSDPYQAREDTWPGTAEVVSTIIRQGSTPLSGTFAITYKNQTIQGLTPDMEAAEFGGRLEGIVGIGTLGVTRTERVGVVSWSVTFKTAGGAHPELEVDASGLIGPQIEVETVTLQHGGIWFVPILGDMLRTAHDDPQVTVNINRIPSSCEGDCSFSWSEAQTPEVTNISPTEGVADTTLTVSGSGFDASNMGSNEVMIGGVACDVTSASASQIECDIGEGLAGVHDVMVTVTHKGMARDTSGKQFSYLFVADSVSPSAGSDAGGSKINIKGGGFSSDSTVTIGGSACDIISADYSDIVCITPTGSGTESIIITANAETNSDLDFTYNSPTASISSISPMAGVVGANTTVTVSGSGFGASQPDQASVLLGGEAVETVSWSDAEITATLPSLAPGSYNLEVFLGAEGYATISIAKAIVYTLEVTSIQPEFGSYNGGTELTITGSGFPVDVDMLTVRVGDADCDVVSSSDSQVVCQTTQGGKTHEVSNTGYNPEHGQGFAWEPVVVEAGVGDSVRWTWTTPPGLSAISGYVIEQMQSATSEAYSAGFKSSATPQPNGVYEYQFSETGDDYYWSGFIDTSEIIALRGVVKVSPRPYKAAALSLTVGGFNAVHNPTSVVVANSGVCSDVTVACDDVPTFEETNGDLVGFMFAECATPKMTQIKVGNVASNGNTNMGTISDVITIEGSGFGSDDCQNEVTIGSSTCDVISSSDSEIQCQVGAGNDLDIAVPNTLSVSVSNLGEALNTIEYAIEKTFTLLPNVESINPASGSVNGGTKVTLTGFGFSGGASVTIMGTPCIVDDETNTQITCTTSLAYAGSADAVVTIAGTIPASCSGDCSYSYSSGATPEVSSFTPSSITNDVTTMQIVGSGFGTSDVAEATVKVGKTECVVSAVSDDAITCELSQPIGGDAQDVSVLLPNGYAGFSASRTIDVPYTISAITPVEGSTKGGARLTLTGSGFDETDISMTGIVCDIVEASRTNVVCVTGRNGQSTKSVSVSSSRAATNTMTFDYKNSASPTVTAITPTSGSAGDVITITGRSLGSDATVMIGDSECDVTSGSAETMMCTLGAHAAGDVTVLVTINPVGEAWMDVSEFTYTLAVSSVSPHTGSLGGNQLVTVSGVGFNADTTVTVCDVACDVQGTPTNTALSCRTPASGTSSSQTCDVIVSIGDSEATLADGYSYDAGMTPVITGVSPRRGGTGGGTRVTVTGTGFGNAADITIDEVECVIDTYSSTQIVCVNGAHPDSVETYVRLEINSNGIATKDDADFEYADAWSSTWTWGGNGIPEAGDLVVIPSTMTVVLDTDTAVMKMLIIQGGKLKFDAADVQLNAEIILITDGGLLQVGTEEEPFEHQATIMLHGHARDPELPIYGTKVLAVRDGTLDLHGKNVGTTWTRLGATAEAGDNTITLNEPISWPVGSEIAIATTGGQTSMPENEQRRITAISGDGRTLTLDSPLEYKHLGETVDVTADVQLEARAEVGLLSHNVVVRGSDNAAFHEKIEACEAGFDVSETAKQTCFQGRFGEEMGSDQFGSQIMFHAARPDEHLAVGRLENVEITYAGQAFRMGRYAIHFHLNGNMKGSYVKSCAIHQSFNRAVNIHGTHEILVERTVGYNIMGGAFFLEDGIETGNVWQYNLAVFVRSSTSLQNADITPAAFWLTNPNNTVRHNVAAGGSHFGFWYRLHAHPEGPSHTDSYCVDKVELGEFRNNTAHSLGWFGLWIFEKYYPMKGGSLAEGNCDASEPAVAVFDTLITWNCDKGVESTGQGSLQFKNFVAVGNKITGLEVKNLGNHVQDYGDEAPMMIDCVVAARAGVLNEQVTEYGITLPLASGFRVISTTLINFDHAGGAAFETTFIAGTSFDDNGGFTYRLEDMTYVNCPNKYHFVWTYDAVVYDIDGTTTGIAGGKVLPTMNTLPSDKCAGEAEFSVGVPASVCSADVKFHRFGMNAVTPNAQGKTLVISNSYGSDTGNFQIDRMSHKEGWVVLILDGVQTDMFFEDMQHVSNFSYSGTAYDFQGDDFVIITHNITQIPNLLTVTGDHRNGTGLLNNDDNIFGDWEFDEETKLFSFIVSAKDEEFPDGREVSVNRELHTSLLLCQTAGCSTQTSSNVRQAPSAERPDDFVLWSEASSWELMEEGWGGNQGGGSFGLPVQGDDVMIPEEMWMVLDVEDLPEFGRIFIHGVLEFENMKKSGGGYYNLSLSAEAIVLHGGRLIIGTEETPFRGTADLILRGDHQSEDVTLGYGPNIGSKSLAVFGWLDMHGTETTRAWVKLGATAEAGQSNVTLSEAVDWPVGAEVLVTTSGMSPYEGETARITAKSSDDLTLTLDIELQYNHMAVMESVDGKPDVQLAAEVGLLSHNVRIVGQDYGKMSSELFGARVLVSSFVDPEEIMFLGSAKLSNVEFKNCGQEGFTAYEDPRFSLAFLQAGEVTDNSSYVRKCSFNYNFSPAIGVFGTQNLEVKDNVIYHTVGSSVAVTGENTRLIGNLIAEMYYTGTYGGRYEDLKLTWDSGVELNKADGAHIHLRDNVVAGSERAGYRVDGQVCEQVENDPSLIWDNNEAHGIMEGVLLLPYDNDGIGPCMTLNGFKIWKAYDFGVYSQTANPTKVTNLVSSDSGLGVLIMVFGPSVSGHEFADNFVEITEAVVIGTSGTWDCATDKLDLSHPNMRHSSKHRGWRTPSGGKVGISVSSFMQSGTLTPVKRMMIANSYPSIRGITRLTDVTFANFETSCGTREDVAITSHGFAQDLQHPVVMRGTTLSNVATDNKVYYHRPNIGFIKPDDCVDMDCDGYKKVVIKDMDGGFLGSTDAAVIPQSEWQWDGDSRRGLGDYRIPATMLQDTDGNRIDVADLAQYRGIHRDNTCTLNSAYQAYTCAGPDYLNAIIESMDADTEDRRLSPVALLSDAGYLDLINGPADWGWCSGWTCQKRLSTFALVVATSHYYTVHYTGTPPQNTRLHLLNADDSQAVVFSIHYTQPWRLDINTGGQYVAPSNGYYDAEGRLLFRAASTDYIPQIETGVSGSNYFDRDTGLLHVLVRGAEPVDIITAPTTVLVFNLPPMSIDEFFGENIINNMAAFFNIPPEKIRLADAVSETSRRRRRATTTLTITIEITDGPYNSTDGYSSNSTLYDVTQMVIDAYQLGTLGSVLGCQILSLSVIEPPADPSSQAWYAMTETGELSSSTELLVADSMELVTEPVADEADETFSTPPAVRMLDSTGTALTQAGSTADPWQVEVTLMTRTESSSSAELGGATIVAFGSDGLASFDDLTISEDGEFALKFTVVSPANADFVVESAYFWVGEDESSGEASASQQQGGLSTGAIAGIAVGVTVLIIAVIVIIVLVVKLNKKKAFGEDNRLMTARSYASTKAPMTPRNVTLDLLPDKFQIEDMDSQYGSQYSVRSSAIPSPSPTARSGVWSSQSRRKVYPESPDNKQRDSGDDTPPPCPGTPRLTNNWVSTTPQERSIVQLEGRLGIGTPGAPPAKNLFTK